MVSFLETANGRFVAGGEAELDKLFERLDSREEPRLLLHVHGGLVDDDVARKHATWLDSEAGYGPLAVEGWETTYLIWRTGLLQTIRINLHELAGDALFSAIKVILRRWLADRAADLGAELDDAMVSSFTTSPTIEAFFRKAEFISAEAIEKNLTASERAIAQGTGEPGPGDSLYDALASDPQLATISERLESALLRRESAALAITPADEAALELFERLDPDVQKGLLETTKRTQGLLAAPLLAPVWWLAAKAGYRALRRALNGRDHGFLATIVEEIARSLYLDLVGSGVWGAMKGDASQHFGSDGAGLKFMAALDQLARSRSEPVRLLFVGHSAGSILACELVRRSGTLPDNVLIDLVLLAPAVRMDQAASNLTAAGGRLNAFRLFTMKDEREKRDALDSVLPIDIYPRSLLYLISGVLETHESKARFRGQSLTVDSDLDSRLAFGGSLGRADWRYGRRVGSDRAAAAT